ncbi:MAG: hypothetical protein DWQ31_09305 [Planctomycetota bacterium]|nr:MAG: hypothetical protein DWQ31_09305 [Planctomycetota bacterium]REJ91354.1 MAG: hypothetical protein DWQ35_14460 [Planctomycetota bacterium]REK18527.1 MAG: hypothetical protein DWQ42_20225 [Planctomycetota bacterium]REK39414.1 MAG: hypothetical protein DWQ46_19280 [Planctomycetota bacterium]
MNERLRAYLELLRLPNVFTALADVFMGAWFVSYSSRSGDLPPLRAEVLAALLAASAGLYLAGMVLNDYFDRDQDAEERPQRPIPSGRVSPQAARLLGIELLLFGVAFAVLASFATGSVKAAAVALVLAGLVVAYDSVLKRTWFGGIAMGGCRGLNVLLGMSAAGADFAWQPVNYQVAAAMGLYVAGVTWFARTEAKVSSRLRLDLSALLMMAALFALAIFPHNVRPPLATQVHVTELTAWNGSWVALGMLIGVLAARAILDPVPAKVQAAVRIYILALIPMNAAICYMMQGRLPALGILVLMLPAMYLGRWIYST